jgi:rubredoxin
MKTYKCLVCGEIFTVNDGEEAICPVCGVQGEDLVLVEEN